MLGIGKIFGLGKEKKSEYFLDLDEVVSQKTAKSAPPAEVSKAPETEVAPAKAEKKAKKTSIKEAKAKQAEATPATPATPKVLPPLNNGVTPTPAGMTFSTDYLVQQPTGSRRRPGPSLDMFKGMARQVGRR
ncbi:MAG: hypothetical protein ACRC8A_00775 [Microcoleaceae cyanobacterium]